MNLYEHYIRYLDGLVSLSSFVDTLTQWSAGKEKNGLLIRMLEDFDRNPLVTRGVDLVDDSAVQQLLETAYANGALSSHARGIFRTFMFSRWAGGSYVPSVLTLLGFDFWAFRYLRPSTVNSPGIKRVRELVGRVDPHVSGPALSKTKHYAALLKIDKELDAIPRPSLDTSEKGAVALLKVDLEGHINGMKDQVPESLHFVWLGKLGALQTDYIDAWVRSNPDYDLNIWYDPDAVLSHMLSKTLKRYAYGLSQDPVKNSSQNKDAITLKLVTLQNKAFAAIQDAMARGLTFDEGAMDFMVSEFGLDRSYFETLRRENLASYDAYAGSLNSRFPARKGLVALREISGLWAKPGDNWAGLYQREIALRGNLAAASDLARLRILSREGGIYIDADMLPAFSRELIQPFEAELGQVYDWFVRERLWKAIQKKELSESDTDAVKSHERASGQVFYGMLTRIVMDRLMALGMLPGRKALLGSAKTYNDVYTDFKRIFESVVLPGSSEGKIMKKFQDHVNSLGVDEVFVGLGKLAIAPDTLYTGYTGKNRLGNAFLAAAGDNPYLEGLETYIDTLYSLLGQAGVDINSLGDINAARDKLVSLGKNFPEIDQRTLFRIARYRLDGAEFSAQTTVEITGPFAYGEVFKTVDGNLFGDENIGREQASPDSPQVFTRHTEEDSVHSWLSNVDDRPEGFYRETTNYKKQIIFRLGTSTSEVKAAQFLYNKHPDRSVLVDVDKKGRARIIAGKANVDLAQLPGNTRIVVVGHDSMVGGLHGISGFSSGNLAKVIQQFGGGRIREVGLDRISIVACSPLRMQAGPGESLLDEHANPQFAEGLIRGLHFMGIEVRKGISSRSGLVQVDVHGRKWIRYIDESGKWVWSRGSSGHKYITTLEAANGRTATRLVDIESGILVAVKAPGIGSGHLNGGRQGVFSTIGERGAERVSSTADLLPETTRYLADQLETGNVLVVANLQAVLLAMSRGEGRIAVMDDVPDELAGIQAIFQMALYAEDREEWLGRVRERFPQAADDLTSALETHWNMVSFDALKARVAADAIDFFAIDSGDANAFGVLRTHYGNDFDAIYTVAGDMGGLSALEGGDNPSILLGFLKPGGDARRIHEGLEGENGFEQGQSLVTRAELGEMLELLFGEGYSQVELTELMASMDAYEAVRGQGDRSEYVALERVRLAVEEAAPLLGADEQGIFHLLSGQVDHRQGELLDLLFGDEAAGSLFNLVKLDYQLSQAGDFPPAGAGGDEILRIRRLVFELDGLETDGERYMSLETIRRRVSLLEGDDPGWRLRLAQESGARMEAQLSDMSVGSPQGHLPSLAELDHGLAEDLETDQPFETGLMDVQLLRDAVYAYHYGEPDTEVAEYVSMETVIRRSEQAIEAEPSLDGGVVDTVMEFARNRQASIRDAIARQPEINGNLLNLAVFDAYAQGTEGIQGVRDAVYEYAAALHGGETLEYNALYEIQSALDAFNGGDSEWVAQLQARVDERLLAIFIQAQGEEPPKGVSLLSFDLSGIPLSDQVKYSADYLKIRDRVSRYERGSTDRTTALRYHELVQIRDQLAGLFHSPQSMGAATDLEVLGRMYRHVDNAVSNIQDVVPKNLHFLWLGRLGQIQVEYIDAWVARNRDYAISLWYDENAVLSHELSRQIKKKAYASTFDPTSTAPGENGIRISEKILVLQNEANGYIREQISQGVTFDQAAMAFMVSRLGGDRDRLETLRRNNLQSYTDAVTYLERRHGQGAAVLRSIPELWADGDAFESHYLQELSLRGNLAAASDIARVRILQQEGGIYADADLLPKISEGVTEGYKTILAGLEASFVKARLNARRADGVIGPGDYTALAWNKEWSRRYFQNMISQIVMNVWASKNMPTRNEMFYHQDAYGDYGALVQEYFAPDSRFMKNLAQFKAKVRRMSPDELYSSLGEMRIAPGTIYGGITQRGILGNGFLAAKGDNAYLQEWERIIHENYRLIQESGARGISSPHDIPALMQSLNTEEGPGDLSASERTKLITYRMDGLTGESMITAVVTGPNSLRTVFQRLDPDHFGLGETPVADRNLPGIQQSNKNTLQYFTRFTEEDSTHSWVGNADDRPSDLYAETTRFDHQIILRLGEGEATRRAANFLFNKHVDRSAMVAVDLDGNLKVIAGEIPSQGLPANSRILVVGHGTGDESGYRIGGLNVLEVGALLKGRVNTGTAQITLIPRPTGTKRVSLVSCNEPGEDGSPTGESFGRALLTALYQSGRPVTDGISIRNGLVQVDAEGRKWVGVFDNEKKLVWSNKGDGVKTIIRMGEEGPVSQRVGLEAGQVVPLLSREYSSGILNSGRRGLFDPVAEFGTGRISLNPPDLSVTGKMMAHAAQGDVLMVANLQVLLVALGPGEHRIAVVDDTPADLAGIQGAIQLAGLAETMEEWLGLVKESYPEAGALLAEGIAGLGTEVSFEHLKNRIGRDGFDFFAIDSSNADAYGVIRANTRENFRAVYTADGEMGHRVESVGDEEISAAAELEGLTMAHGIAVHEGNGIRPDGLDTDASVLEARESLVIDRLFDAAVQSTAQLQRRHQLSEEWMPVLSTLQEEKDGYRLQFVNRLEPEKVRWISTDDEHLRELKKFMDEHIETVVADEASGTKGRPVSPGEDGEGPDGLNSAFAIQYIIDLAKQRQRDGVASDVKISKTLENTLVAHHVVAGLQIAYGVVMDAAKVTKLVRSMLRSGEIAAQSASAFSKAFSVAGEGIGAGFAAANVVLDAIQVSQATTESEKAVFGTQLAFDTAGLALSIAGIGAGLAGAATAGAIIGGAGAIVAGLGIGFAALAENYAVIADKADGIGKYFHDIDTGYSNWGFYDNTLESGGKVLKPYVGAVITKVDFRNDKVHYGSQYISESSHGSTGSGKINYFFWAGDMPTEKVHYDYSKDEWVYDAPLINIRKELGYSDTTRLRSSDAQVVVLPFTPEVQMRGLNWQMLPGSTTKSDTGFDVLRRLENNYRFDFDFYIFPSEYIMYKIDHFNYQHTTVSVDLDASSRSLIVPQIPEIYRSYINYSLNGKGGVYSVVLNDHAEVTTWNSGDIPSTWVFDLSNMSDTQRNSATFSGNEYRVGNTVVRFGDMTTGSRYLVSKDHSIYELDVKTHQYLLLEIDAFDQAKKSSTGDHNTFVAELAKKIKNHPAKSRFVKLTHYHPAFENLEGPDGKNSYTREDTGTAWFDTRENRVIYADVGNVVLTRDLSLLYLDANGVAYMEITKNGATELWAVNTKTRAVENRFALYQYGESGATTRISGIWHDGHQLMVQQEFKTRGGGSVEFRYRLVNGAMQLATVRNHYGFVVDVRDRGALPEDWLSRYLVKSTVPEIPFSQPDRDDLSKGDFVPPKPDQWLSAFHGDTHKVWVETTSKKVVVPGMGQIPVDLILIGLTELGETETPMFFSPSNKRVYRQEGLRFRPDNVAWNRLTDEGFETPTTPYAVLWGWVHHDGAKIVTADTVNRGGAEEHVALLDTGRITQPLEGLVDGSHYTLSFRLAGGRKWNRVDGYWLLEYPDGGYWSDPQSEDGLRVIWNGQVVGEYRNLGDWQDVELTLIGGAGDGTDLLEFEGMGPVNGTGTLVDDISFHDRGITQYDGIHQVLNHGKTPILETLDGMLKQLDETGGTHLVGVNEVWLTAHKEREVVLPPDPQWLAEHTSTGNTPPEDIPEPPRRTEIRNWRMDLRDLAKKEAGGEATIAVAGLTGAGGEERIAWYDGAADVFVIGRTEAGALLRYAGVNDDKSVAWIYDEGNGRLLAQPLVTEEGLADLFGEDHVVDEGKSLPLATDLFAGTGMGITQLFHRQSGQLLVNTDNGLVFMIGEGDTPVLATVLAGWEGTEAQLSALLENTPHLDIVPWLRTGEQRWWVEGEKAWVSASQTADEDLSFIGLNSNQGSAYLFNKTTEALLTSPLTQTPEPGQERIVGKFQSVSRFSGERGDTLLLAYADHYDGTTPVDIPIIDQVRYLVLKGGDATDPFLIDKDVWDAYDGIVIDALDPDKTRDIIRFGKGIDGRNFLLTLETEDGLTLWETTTGKSLVINNAMSDNPADRAFSGGHLDLFFDGYAPIRVSELVSAMDGVVADPDRLVSYRDLDGFLIPEAGVTVNELPNHYRVGPNSPLIDPLSPESKRIYLDAKLAGDPLVREYETLLSGFERTGMATPENAVRADLLLQEMAAFAAKAHGPVDEGTDFRTTERGTQEFVSPQL